MPIATITRSPDHDPPVTPGMRDTAGQDTLLEAPKGWRHDRRVRDHLPRRGRNRLGDLRKEWVRHHVRAPSRRAAK